MQVKKEPDSAATPSSRIEIYPSTVYHMIRTKGQKTMIEIKITANTAEEITEDIMELAQRVTGTHCIEVKPAVAKVKKAKKVAKEEPAKEEPVKEKPVKEEKTYTVDEVRKAVKDFVQADAANKAKVADFLHNNLKVKSISEADVSVYPEIMKFVGGK